MAEAMATTVHFSIKYDGPALAAHQMDVRELAPALLALSTLLEEANRIAFPGANEVRVEVSGSFKGGSFGVDLVAIQSLADQLVSILSGPNATAATNLLGILGGLGLLGTGGVIGLLKWLRGRKPSAIRQVKDKVVVELRVEETVETFEVDLVAGKLFQSRVVRQALARVIKPLEQEGIDLFATAHEGRTQTVVTKDEAPAFDFSAADAEIVSDTTSDRVLLQIESAVFKEDNKWRFNDGATSFHAEIADREFLERIESGAERFGKGDVLVVRLRRVQTITDNGLKWEFTVERVLEHRAPLQQSLLR